MDPLAALRAHTVDLHSADELKERLAAGRPLRVKLGVDPTRPDLTFGHMVVFNKLRQFQELGHTAVLIIGDFTTLIGDPSGRSDLRPVLSADEIAGNARTYLDQAFKILDPEKTEVRHNSEWFKEMSFVDCLGLAREMTVARMLERDDFAKRYQANTPISIVEFLYPLVQGYDSVMVAADVEIGGTDQLFNLLVGRALQKNRGQAEQIVLTMPLLVGLDGVKKMSKSLDNYIAFNDTPTDMFGKIMSVSDDAMWAYYELLLLDPPETVAGLKAGHPMDAKKALARRLTARLYDEATATAELNRFEKVFSQRDVPDDMPAFAFTALSGGEPEMTVTNLLAATNLFPSKKEVRRLVEQGAVKLNGEKLDDPNHVLTAPAPDADPLILQAGKRKWCKVE